MSIYTIDRLGTLNDFWRLSTNERTKLTTLRIHLLLDDTAFNRLLESLPQCKQLKTVELNDHLFRSHPDFFIALGNAIAKLNGIKISLRLYSSIDAINDTLKNALSTWPIKTLCLTRNSNIITRNFWLAIENAPIEAIDFSECTFTVNSYKALQTFLTQSKTVRSLDMGKHMAFINDKPKLHAFFDALAAGKRLQVLILYGNSLANLTPKNLKKFCSTLAQLKNLQLIDLSGNGFGLVAPTRNFEILCRDGLSQLPNLQAMDLSTVEMNHQNPLANPVFYEDIFEGLKYLRMLSDVKIEGLKEQNPWDPQVQKFRRIELTLQACGLSGNPKNGTVLTLAAARQHILLNAYGAAYIKYYQEGFFSYIKEQNRSRYLAPFITVSSILNQLGWSKRIRLAILKHAFPRRHAKLAESVDNSISQVFERRKQQTLTLEGFTALSPERHAVINTFNIRTQYNRGYGEINNLSQQLLSSAEAGLQITRQLHDNLLQCSILHTLSLAEELATSQVKGLIAIGKICAEQALLKTFKIVYSRHLWDTYGFNKEMLLKLISSLEKLQNAFNTMGFETKRITSSEYYSDMVSGNPNVYKKQLAPQDIPGALENRVTTADRYTTCGAMLTFKFVRKRKAQVVAEEQQNTLRLSNG